MNFTSDFTSLSWLFFWIDFSIRIFFGARIIKRKLSPGVAWAWLSLLAFVPLVGTVLYLSFGEYRQPRRRLKRLRKARAYIDHIAKSHVAENLDLGSIAHLASSFTKMFGLPAQGGNDIELLQDATQCFSCLIEDVDRATRSIDLEFYIWSDGGLADEFGQALIRAAARGLKVRLLVDAIGSAKFIKGPRFRKMRDAGVMITVALPPGFWKSLFARPDLRIHRKIAVIDGSIGYTGSLNLADPKYFKAEAGVGQWVDALARVRGPAVRPLYSVFLSDWCAETGADFSEQADRLNWQDMAQSREAVIQCLPSGPALTDSEIEQALIMAINAARVEITLTTPYFVPSDSLRFALVAAVRRGVRTTLIVPKRVDSKLTHYASRSFLRDLLDAGVIVGLYREGLLHTKSVMVDGEFSLFGSLNLDPRSLRINFEVTIAVYDRSFARVLSDLQGTYLKHSDLYTQQDVDAQSALYVWKCDLARLLGPLL